MKFVVPQIKDGGKVERAYLGVSNGTPPDRSGALVDNVVASGPAAAGRPAAGRQDHRRSTTRTIKSSEDVSAAVTARKPGEQAKVTWSRGGGRRTLTVHLGTRPETQAPGLPMTRMTPRRQHT